MPGPRNRKQRRQGKPKIDKSCDPEPVPQPQRGRPLEKRRVPEPHVEQYHAPPAPPREAEMLSPLQLLTPPQPLQSFQTTLPLAAMVHQPPAEELPEQPHTYLYDPGNGPRVRDTRTFLSSYFAHPPSLSDPLCAEFAQEEVLQMLTTVLPEETALILWYNKSRSKGRICPACKRLYRLGDNLPSHLTDPEGTKRVSKSPSVQLKREQQLSGLCSLICFVLTSLSNPDIISDTWGQTAEEISDETWDLLDANLLEGHYTGPGKDTLGLSLLLKMTRLDDLGLEQLCLNEPGWEGAEVGVERP